MSGAGNTFLITYFESFPASLRQKNWMKLSQKFCDSKTGIEADGLVILLPRKKTGEFEWLFYNKDGSLAQMCGNAACCVVVYAFKKHLIVERETFTLKTQSQKIKGDLKKGSGRIFVKETQEIKGPFTVQFKKKPLSYHFINALIPHAVIEKSHSLDTKDKRESLKEIGQWLRNKKDHDEEGMNVSFYQKTHQDNLLLGCSFERGVEDITPACGTGALALAQIHHRNFPKLNPIFVQMPGGKLEIGFHENHTLSVLSPVEWMQETEMEM